MYYECENTRESNKNETTTTKNRRKRVIAELIKVKGWISQQKQDGVFRLFSVNPHGFGFDKVEKVR